ncbi:hypothetical protein C5167_031764 [Papaver somniferum]|uniref:Uncharacterized protein n=1 Tax=Papaver somniferum TaxID=3469 RepID=A0A4Y7K995_PAPSO|nr:hypothetical protein C5167_031764 [Papaver somniferum]
MFSDSILLQILACAIYSNWSPELADMSDFGKAVKLLGACEGKPLGKSFTDLGTKSKVLSVKLEKEVGTLSNMMQPSDREPMSSSTNELAEAIKLKEIITCMVTNSASPFNSLHFAIEMSSLQREIAIPNS